MSHLHEHTFPIIFGIQRILFGIVTKMPKLQNTSFSTAKISLRQNLLQNMKEIDSKLLSLNEKSLTQTLLYGNKSFSESALDFLSQLLNIYCLQNGSIII